ncbi:MAG: hypothetical protein P1U58_12155 [Verrucomicrobiales bacterium]|nr:hypothetical protein [Verrucomicrobiales bacterium]
MSNSLSPEVEALLRCPVTGQKLRLAEADDLIPFNAALAEGAWITEDSSRVYPVRDGFPILIPDESLAPGKDSSN